MRKNARRALASADGSVPALGGEVVGAAISGW
jgi:hypothetical protein